MIAVLCDMNSPNTRIINRIPAEQAKKRNLCDAFSCVFLGNAEFLLAMPLPSFIYLFFVENFKLSRLIHLTVNIGNNV